ncbi:MAG: DUF4412 domain-containing protein [Planctomycetes bacterium]|nr:DUF4412 domain-containing protein [Planctomycetota bacterium]
MKIVSSLALIAALAGPALCGDLVVTKQKHSDAMEMPGQSQPAKDTTEVLWIGKDRLRVDEGDTITIVRADLKKLYTIDAKAKTYTALDLPIDLKKYMPAEMAPMMEQMSAQMKVTVTPTTETKKIKDWDATRFTMNMSMPMGGGMTQELWVVKGLGAEHAGWQEMYASLSASNPFGGSMAAEMKKIDGMPVLIERSQKMMGHEMKSREEVVSIEDKEPAADFYELPTGLTEKPFDPMAGMQMGGPGGKTRQR